MVGLLVATACGSPGPPADRTLSAAGQAGAEPAPAPTSTTSPTTTVTVTVPPTTVAPPTTTAKRPTTPTRAPAPPPPPPPSATTTPTIALDTFAPVTTSVTQGPTTVTMRAVTEEYLGEKVYVEVEAGSTEYISSVRIDFGDGYVTTDPQRQRPAPGPNPPMFGGAQRAHIYPAAGRYRITVTVTLVPGLWNFALSPTEPPWFPTGPEHTVTVAANLLQRPDTAPPGYPRLPALVSE